MMLIHGNKIAQRAILFLWEIPMQMGIYDVIIILISKVFL